MIPFGPWHPDKAGINVNAVNEARNCLPGVNGFRPLPSLAPVSDALSGDCIGAAVVFDDSGVVHTFAGDATKLYKLQSTAVWDDVSRTSGGAYASGGGERWQFGISGGLVIATTITDVVQKYLLGTSSDFTALGGTPPQARYIDTMREFVILGGLLDDEMTVHWSGLANPEHWTPGTQSCDTQTFQSGGPVRGIVGGEIAYVFQADKIQRMTYVPGSASIMQFDEIEGGRGLLAPYSLVRLGGRAFYLASDGFYELNLSGASARQLGVGKWAKTIAADIRRGTEINIIGAADPLQQFVLWGYVGVDATGSSINRTLIYDWTLDEATTADLSITAVAQILSQGVTLDTMDSYGTMDTLPFSLDSPAWLGGAGLLGLFGTDRKLSVLGGSSMSATFTTNDGEGPRRNLIKATRPHIDTRAVQVAVSMREAQGDVAVFGAAEMMESTGVVPAWQSGFLGRARVTVPAGTVWSKITGMDTVIGGRGNR